MTRFAPPTLYQCPACAGYFKRYVLMSLHFYDDLPEWSDGMSGQWWAKAGAPVGRCPSCAGIVWLEDVADFMPAPIKPWPIGSVDRLWYHIIGDRRGRLREEREWAALPLAIREAESIDGLRSAQDFIEALVELAVDETDREIYLRRRLLLASNDHLRRRMDQPPAGTQPAVAPAVALANKLCLLELVESDPERQVERGELLRQLGRFDEAVAVLKAVKPDGYNEVMAVKIERLARAGIAELQDLNVASPRSLSVDGANHAQPGGIGDDREHLTITASAGSGSSCKSSKRRFLDERADDYIIPSFLLPETRRSPGTGLARRGKGAPDRRIRYTLPDHARTLRGRLMQAIVDRLHRNGD
jgi:hypothetical protein